MSAEEPFLRVMRGNPTCEEIAALVAVLLDSQSDAAAVDGHVQQPRSAWADPAQVVVRSRSYLLPQHA